MARTAVSSIGVENSSQEPANNDRMLSTVVKNAVLATDLRSSQDRNF
ncbi:hypothetical protein SynPROSU1_01769 [Synechococcus sp. PROS-U-1]|nr:hypothetical protein SynPROSU1_01769 [Synechococcus sp. PROS-U-1]